MNLSLQSSDDRDNSRKRDTIMKYNLPICAALATILMSSSFVPSLKADEYDKRTIITISQPIDVQGTILPAGQYVLRLHDSSSARDIVNIFNGEETRLITTVMAIPADRIQTPEKSEFSFYEATPGRPVALHTWFYPGNENGVEFVGPQHNAPASSATLAASKSTSMRSAKHTVAGKSVAAGS
jgi:hypothetical protein